MATTSNVTWFAPAGKVLADNSNWEIQTGANPTITRQRAQALKADGDEFRSVQYGAQIAYTETAVPATTDGNLTLPNCGTVNGCHVDSVQLAYSNTGFPTLTVNSHQHASVSGTAEAHDETRTYAPSVTLPNMALGCPEKIEGVFDASSLGVGVRSLTYQLQSNHIDEPNSTGGHLAGEDYDGTETITIEFTGDVTIGELSIGSDWKLPDNEAHTPSNTGATTTSVTITHHIAHTDA